MLPSIFVSHGSPALTLMNNKTTKFLKSLATLFDTPKYILVISAHWTTNTLEILYKTEASVIYDFYNFPKELYEQEYPAKSDKSKENEIIELLKKNNILITKNKERVGYDHGVWSPLSLIYPKANIPIIQLSLPMNYSIEELIKLGETLIPLRKDTLILTSGAMTHNLGEASWNENDTSINNYAKEFHDWIIDKTKNGDMKELIDFRDKAPYVMKNHPTLEHFLPFFISLGASENRKGESLHNYYIYGNQSMDTILFKE